MTELRSEPRFSFTQPVCTECYDRRYPSRQPSRLLEPEIENCCDCTRPTRAGIYIRVDPATVELPTRLK